MPGRRSRYWVLGLVAAGVVLVGTAVGVRALTRPAPSGYSATVTGCDVGSAGLAQVSYAVTNRDRVAHGYRVLVTVAAGSTPLGWGESQINAVAPGRTGSARVPVALSGVAGRPTCTAHVEVNDEPAAHHVGHGPSR